jgi:hypothetical protein
MELEFRFSQLDIFSNTYTSTNPTNLKPEK